MKLSRFLFISILLLVVCIMFVHPIHFPNKDSENSVDLQLPQANRYALKHKKNNTLHPLTANQSAAYTEFYKIGKIEIQSTNYEIHIALTNHLKINYVLYDYDKNCDITISSSLQTDDIYCENNTLVITNGLSSIDSE